MSERREPLDCYVMKPNWTRRFTDYELVGMPCEWNDYECIHIKEVLPSDLDKDAQIKALQEENKALTEVVEFYADRKNWRSILEDTEDSFAALDSSILKDDGEWMPVGEGYCADFIGGKRARQYLASRSGE